MFKEYLGKLVATKNDGIGRIVGYDYIDGSLIIELEKGKGGAWGMNTIRRAVYLYGYELPEDKSLSFIGTHSIIKVIKEEK